MRPATPGMLRAGLAPAGFRRWRASPGSPQATGEPAAGTGERDTGGTGGAEAAGGPEGALWAALAQAPPDGVPLWVLMAACGSPRGSGLLPAPAACPGGPGRAGGTRLLAGRRATTGQAGGQAGRRPGRSRHGGRASTGPGPPAVTGSDRLSRPRLRARLRALGHVRAVDVDVDDHHP